MDSYKTELIADRVWRTRAQLELATVEYVGWFNHQRLHESLGEIPPIEFEQRYAASERLTGPISGERSAADRPPRPADRLTTRPPAAVEVPRSPNGAQRLSLPATTSAPAANSSAPNDSWPRTVSLPPVEMTSRGQPPNGCQQIDEPGGLPTGLGQPPNGPWRDGRPRGLSTFPQALPLSSNELNDKTTKRPN